MKSILLSIQPQWVAKILNGEKTIEIRKKFPKDYVGWVYLYCAKGSKREYLTDMRKNKPLFNGMFEEPDFFYCNDGMIGSWGSEIVNGGVVARFWCDMVGIFDKKTFGTYENYYSTNQQELLENSCLTEKQLDDYLQGKDGYAIHISKLEVFEKPRELSKFVSECKHNCLKCKHFDKKNFCQSYYTALTKAPSNYCCIESED